MYDVFKREIEVLENAEELLISGKLESVKDIEHYQCLVQEYKGLLNQARRLVKIADLMELKLKHIYQGLEEISNTDFLTNLFNRRYFEENLKKEWLRSLRLDLPLSIIMIDIDHFKEYNDTYGHAEGDKCLQNIAGIIQKSIKKQNGLAARFGGEEFIILLPETDLAEVRYLAELIADNIARLDLPHRGSPIYHKVSVSMGIASLRAKEDITHDILVKMADDALYLAKAEGKNCIREYA